MSDSTHRRYMGESWTWDLNQQRNGAVFWSFGQSDGNAGYQPIRPIRLLQLTFSGEVKTTSGGTPLNFLVTVYKNGVSSSAPDDRIFQVGRNLQLASWFTVSTSTPLSSGIEIVTPQDFLIMRAGNPSGTWSVLHPSVEIDYEYL